MYFTFLIYDGKDTVFCNIIKWLRFYFSAVTFNVPFLSIRHIFSERAAGGRAKYGVAIFGVGLIYDVSVSEHDKSNLELP